MSLRGRELVPVLNRSFLGRESDQLAEERGTLVSRLNGTRPSPRLESVLARNTSSSACWPSLLSWPSLTFPLCWAGLAVRGGTAGGTLVGPAPFRRWGRIGESYTHITSQYKIFTNSNIVNYI